MPTSSELYFKTSDNYVNYYNRVDKGSFDPAGHVGGYDDPRNHNHDSQFMAFYLDTEYYVLPFTAIPIEVREIQP